LFFTIIIVVFCKSISEWQGNINAYSGYVAIAPAIIISSLIATLRGYFQGIENMVPTTVSLIVEQIIKLTIGLILAHRLCVLGVGYAVLGAILGVTISEIVALIIISINYISYKGQLSYNYRNLNFKIKKKIDYNKYLKTQNVYNKTQKLCVGYYRENKNRIRYTTKNALKIIFKTAIPSTFASIIIPISTMLDSFMIINLLASSGYSSHISTALYGLLGGVVQSMTSLPIILISGISTALIPSLSGLVAQNDTNEIKKKVALFIKLTIVLSIILFIVMFVFAEDYILFLYGDGLDNSVINEFDCLVKMMKINSVSIFYYALLQTFISILQAMGKPFVPFFTLLLGLIIRTLLVWVLVSIPNINIYGAIISNVLFLVVVTVILAIIIKKKIDIKYDLFNHLITPIIVGIIVFVGVIVLNWALKSIMNYFVSMLISAIVGLVFYMFWIYFSKVFTVKEKKIFNIKDKSLSKKSEK
jgi:stage V sporulation protein B